jgi:hypothetical protein
MKNETSNRFYGLVAAYPTPEALLKGAEQVRRAGYTHTDALTPFPVHGLVDALGIPKSKMAGLVLAGATVGCLAGFGLQYWLSCIQYPHITSGRPFFSWPNFIPVIFECTVLFAGLTAFIGMLVRNNLPRPYHPVFAAPRVDDATSSKFMIVIEASDPKFDLRATQALLQASGAEFVGVAPFEPSGEGQDDGPLMH